MDSPGQEGILHGLLRRSNTPPTAAEVMQNPGQYFLASHYSEFRKGTIMSTKLKTPSVADLGDTFNVLPGLANIYLTSSKRLGELAVQTASKAAEDYVSVTNAATRMNSSPVPFAFQSVLSQPAFERTLTYFRETCEILTQAQAEAARLCGKQFSLPAGQFSVAQNLDSVFSAWAGGIKKLSAITEANAAAATQARETYAAATELHKKPAA